MASSSVSPMLLFVLLLLVSPHMDQVVGAPTGIISKFANPQLWNKFKNLFSHTPNINLQPLPKLPPIPKVRGRPTLTKEQKDFLKVVIEKFIEVFKEVLQNHRDIENRLQNNPEYCQLFPTACPRPTFLPICVLYAKQYGKIKYCPSLKFVEHVELCLLHYDKHPTSKKCPSLEYLKCVKSRKGKCPKP